jgi:hypothetical protein
VKLQDRIRELLGDLGSRPERPTPTSVLRPLAREVEPFLGLARFDASRYMRHPIYLREGWEVMVIAWEPGQKTPIHDHRGVLGSMAVFSGSLMEERFETPEGRPNLIDRSVRPSGDLCEIGPTILHRLSPSDGRALSLHVYRPPLKNMGIWDASGMTEVRGSEYDVPAGLLADAVRR